MTSSPPMLTTNIVGGLGNQLFLVANLLATSKRHNDVKMFLPRCQWSSSIGPPRPVYWSSLFSQLESKGSIASHAPSYGNNTVVIPETRPVQPIQLSQLQSSTVYSLTGFFQSAKYFDDVAADDLWNLVPESLVATARDHLFKFYYPSASLVPREEVHSCAIHVRRGDYLDHRETFEVLEFDYYHKAVQVLFGAQLHKETFRVAHGANSMKDFCVSPTAVRGEGAGGCHKRMLILIFCEDARYATTMAGTLMSMYPGVHAVHVSETSEARTLTHTKEPELLRKTSMSMPREVLELLMMTACDDVVIGNSSFSWWGAYWNRSPLKRVVAPSKWFVKEPFPKSRHLYCDDWLIL